MEYFYKQKKLKQEEKIKIGSGHMWAKNDNLILYEELFHKTINWDLSEAEFAKKLKEICFNNSHILFTGKGKDPEGYLYNGVYWVDLSLHNAELKQKHFDNLYKYYLESLQKEKHSFDEKYFNTLMSQIKTLNSNKTRTNVLKIFQADNYISVVEWNKNKNLFVFENCVYDLETDKFIPSNPEDYINTSCGYDYNEGEQKHFIDTKKKLKEFVNHILQESDQTYI
jgi:hypothetical protein